MVLEHLSTSGVQQSWFVKTLESEIETQHVPGFPNSPHFRHSTQRQKQTDWRKRSFASRRYPTPRSATPYTSLSPLPTASSTL